MPAKPVEIPDPGELLWPGELAARLRVHVKTVAVWRREGKIPAEWMFTAPSGRVRYRAGFVDSLTAGDQS